MTAPTAIEVVATEFAAICKIEHAISTHRAKKRDLEAELDAARARRFSLEEAEAHDAGLRLLEGDDAAPVDKARAAEISKLSRRIPALLAAIPLQADQIAELRSELTAHQRPLRAVVLDFVDAVQGAAVENIAERLSALADDLASLIAADIVREDLIGSTYTLPDDGRVPPFGGRFVAERMLNNIPTRLRPPELETEGVFARAREVADETLKQIKES